MSSGLTDRSLDIQTRSRQSLYSTRPILCFRDRWPAACSLDLDANKTPDVVYRGPYFSYAMRH